MIRATWQSHPGDDAVVDAGLAHPRADRLHLVLKLRGDPLLRAVVGTQLRAQGRHQTPTAWAFSSGVYCRASSASPVSVHLTRHDSILVSRSGTSKQPGRLTVPASDGDEVAPLGTFWNVAQNYGRADLNAALDGVPTLFVKKALAAIPQHLPSQERVITVGIGDCETPDGHAVGLGVCTLTEQRLLHINRKVSSVHDFPLSQMKDLYVDGSLATFDCGAGRHKIGMAPGQQGKDFLQALVQQTRLVPSQQPPNVERHTVGLSHDESVTASPATPIVQPVQLQEPPATSSDGLQSHDSTSVSRVTKWDYMHLVIDQKGLAGGKTPADLSQQLGRLGSEGWELVSAFPITQGSGVTVKAVYLFKRPYD